MSTIALVALVVWLANTGPDFSMPPVATPLDPEFATLEVERDAVTLNYLGATRSCFRFVELVVEETDDLVQLTLVEERYSKEEFCTAEGVFLSVTVHLESSIGERRVVDATSGQQLEVS